MLEIIIDNTGNPNPRLLKQILKTAFPRDLEPDGICKYYRKHPNSNYLWTCNYTPAFPTIPLVDFIEKTAVEGFFVVIEDNNGVQILDFLKSKGFENTNYYRGSLRNDYSYGVLNGSNDISTSSLSVEDLTRIGYAVYTLQELKNQYEMTTTKKIIGYKAPFDMRKGEVKQGDIYVIDSPEFATNQKVRGCKMEVEVVRTWEPVYQIEAVTIKMGDSFDLTIKDGKVFHKAEDITAYVESLTKYFYHNQKFNGYDATIDEITFSKTGCEKVTTKLSEWEAVYKILKEQN